MTTHTRPQTRRAARKELFSSGKPAPADFNIDKVRIRQGEPTKQSFHETEFRAFYGTRWIGYISLSGRACDDCAENERTVYKAAVDEAFRRKGVATKLYDAAETWLASKGMKLVPGMGVPLHSVSDDAYKLWQKRSPEHPRVLNDGRRYNDQYVGKPIEYKGEQWFIRSVGRKASDGSLFFGIGDAMENPTKTSHTFDTKRVFDLYGEPSTPKHAAAAAAPDDSPLKIFMNELRAATTENPFDRHERVWQNLVGIEVYPYEDMIHISSIRSFEKGKGNASKGLRMLCALADKLGVTLDCEAVPYGSKELDEDQLTAWYQRNGFVSDEMGGLTRKPKGAQPSGKSNLLKLSPGMMTIDMDRPTEDKPSTGKLPAVKLHGFSRTHSLITPESKQALALPAIEDLEVKQRRGLRTLREALEQTENYTDNDVISLIAEHLKPVSAALVGGSPAVMFLPGMPAVPRYPLDGYLQGGQYHSDTETVEVNLLKGVSVALKYVIMVNNRHQWEGFVRGWLSLTTHEATHSEQLTRRTKDKDPEEQQRLLENASRDYVPGNDDNVAYLLQPIEMAAFARGAVSEWRSAGLKRKQIEGMLKDKSQWGTLAGKSDSFRRYYWLKDDWASSRQRGMDYMRPFIEQIERALRASEKQASGSMSSEQIESKARYWQEVGEPGTQAEGSAEDFDWSFNPNFDLEEIFHFPANEMWAAEEVHGWDDDYRDKFDRAIESGSIEPVFVVEGRTNHSFYLWDGNHRAARAFELGVGTLPAYVGVRKQPTDSTKASPKTAYISPRNAELTVAIENGVRSQVTIGLDLGIPKFTQFTITFPTTGLQPAEVSSYSRQALSALLDDIAAFMVSLKYDEAEIIEITSLAEQCFHELEGKNATDSSMSDQDENLRLYEGEFEIPESFVDNTYKKVVTAALVRRTPSVRHLELSDVEIPDAEGTPDDVIRFYRDQSTRSTPRAFEVKVITKEQPAKPPLAKDWKARMLVRTT